MGLAIPLLRKASPYDAAASALFAAMTTQPDATRKALINDLIKGLKADGVWDKVDFLHVYAAHDSQAACLNWKNPATFTATLVNSPTFTADRDFTTDGVASYVESNWNPATNGVNFTQDAGSLMCWSRYSPNISAASYGWFGGGASANQIAPRGVTGNMQGRVNSSTTVNTANSGNGLGFYIVSRASAAGLSVTNYRNGVSLGSGGSASTVPQSVTFKVGRTDVSSYAPASAAMFGAGGNLTDTDAGNAYTRFNTYMTAIGAA